MIILTDGRPPAPLSALSMLPVTLDHPFAVMPGVDPAKAAASTALRERLSGETYKNDLAKAGLRAPDGSTGTGFAGLAGAPATIKPAARPADPRAAAGAVGQLLGSRSAITKPGRRLAVFDVSGSMKDKVATAGGDRQDRAQVRRRHRPAPRDARLAHHFRAGPRSHRPQPRGGSHVHPPRR